MKAASRAFFQRHGAAEPWQTRWDLTNAPRKFQLRTAARCRKRRISSTVQVQRASDQTTIGLSGVATCKNVWSCACCSARICSSRAEELQKAIAAHEGEVSLLTLTVAHDYGDKLRATKVLARDATRALFRGAAGKRLARKLGLRHRVVAFEPTYGENGWHPHIHALILHSRPPEPGAVDSLRERWQRIVERLSWKARPSLEHGADLRPSHQAEYIAKLGLELTNTLGKRSGKRSLTHWEILAAAIEDDPEARRLWIEFTDAMLGAKQLTWSTGARVALGLSERDEDVDHAEEPPAMLLLEVPGEVWDRCSKRPGWTAELLKRARGRTPFLDCAEWLRRSQGPP